MKKRTVKWIGLLLVICQMTIPAYAGSSFPDVPDTASYAEAVNLMKEYGIFNGDADGNFNPSSGITRAEFAAIICRMVGGEDEIQMQVEASFNDVPANHWAAGYIGWAVKNEIINGYGDGRYGPSDFVTYEQAIKMTVCAAGYGDAALDAGGWPEGYIDVANGLGLLTGVDETPSAPMTRANVAVMISNLFL